MNQNASNPQRSMPHTLVTKSNAQHLYLQQRKPTDAIQTYHQNVHKWAHQNPNRSTKGINQTSQKCNTKKGGKGEGRICIAAAADPTEPAAAPSPYPRIAPILAPLKPSRCFPQTLDDQEVYQRKGRTPTDRPTSNPAAALALAPARGLSGVSIWSADLAGDLPHPPPRRRRTPTLLTSGLIGSSSRQHPTTRRREGDFSVLTGSPRTCGVVGWGAFQGWGGHGREPRFSAVGRGDLSVSNE
jgi:hypothetical protein